MEEARHEFLAGPRLAVDEYGGRARLRRALEAGKRALQTVARPHDLHAAGRGLAQPAHLLAQPRVLERAIQDDAQVAQVGRLEHEVVRAELDRAHRLLHRAVPGQHHDRERGFEVPQLAQHAQPILVAQLEVEHHRVHAALAHRLDRLTGARGLERGIALVASPFTDAETQRSLVIDDEQRAFRLRPGRAVAFRHFVSPAGS